METEQNFSQEVMLFLKSYDSVIQLDEDYNLIEMYNSPSEAMHMTSIPESIIVGAMLNKEKVKEGYYFVPSILDLNDRKKHLTKMFLRINTLGLIDKIYNSAKELKTEYNCFSNIYKCMKEDALVVSKKYKNAFDDGITVVKTSPKITAYGYYWKRVLLVTYNTQKQTKLPLASKVYRLIYNRKTKAIYKDLLSASEDTKLSTDLIYNSIFKPAVNTDIEWTYIRTNHALEEHNKLSKIISNSSVHVLEKIKDLAKKNKKVVMLDACTHEVISTFKTASEAQTYTGICNIYKALKDSTHTTLAGGYSWLYEKDLDDYKQFIKLQSNVVFMVHPETYKVEARFISVRAMMKETDCQRYGARLYKALKNPFNQEPKLGHLWMYEKDYNKFIENQIQDML